MELFEKSRHKCRRRRATPRRVGLFIVLLCVFFASSGWARACNELEVGASFWVRLTTPISSYTAKPGSPVRGFLLESPECDDAPVFAMKVPVEGQVVSAHRVGLGLWHETAGLEIEFLRIIPEGVAPVPIRARVTLVDNARENVKNGVIHGIRSTDTPQGRISSRLKYLPSLHLYPDPFLLGFKMLFPVFPEPEIQLAAGTDLQAELTQPVELPADLAPVPPVPPLDHERELARDLSGLPDRTFTGKGKEADVINIVFAGSPDELEQAFQAAGWRRSEKVSRRAVMRQFYAFLAKTNYATAPMSNQYLDGQRADLTLEKTFDSYGKRNHLRIWKLEQTWEGEPLWASAAVRETGATLSVRQKGFMHHVSGDLNEEQRVILRDLRAAGCVDAAGSMARPEMDRLLENATGEYFYTDGTLAIIRLKACDSASQQAEFSHTSPKKPGSRIFRYARRQILTVRSDLWRANCIYTLYDLTQMTVKAVRQTSSHRAEAEAFRRENQQPLYDGAPSLDVVPLTDVLGP
jgi:hypothetical protein